MSKPLGHKSYGSIPHLSSTRLGPGDHRIEAGQERILTEKKRDQYDHIIVQEKLDGTNVAVANVEGRLVPLSRAVPPVAGASSPVVVADPLSLSGAQLESAAAKPAARETEPASRRKLRREAEW